MKAEQYFDVSGVSFKDFFAEIRYVWEVIPKLQAYIHSLFQKGVVEGNYKKSPFVFIGKGTTIEEGALIKGPAIIGENSSIGHAAFIRQNCLFGNNVRIGHGSEVKNSIVFPNSAVAHLNYVGDSIIGSRVNVAGGVKLANFRFDGDSIKVSVGGERIDTGLVKFGAVIGDGCGIGANAVLNPGTILGKHCVVYPLVSVRGVHEEGSVIK